MAVWHCRVATFILLIHAVAASAAVVASTCSPAGASYICSGFTVLPIFGAPHFTNFTCTRCNLTSLPADILRSRVLTAVVLSSSLVLTIDPAAFHSLTGLTVLRLDSNMISMIPNGTFRGLKNLTTLHLERNRLRTIPSGEFQELPNLVQLYMNHNKPLQIQTRAFLGLGRLTHLHLQNSGIPEILPGTFEGLANLQELNLARNSITRAESGAYRELTKLRKLDLGKNKISVIVPGAFQGLAQLTTLYLSANDISNILPGTFRGLVALQVAYLKENTNLVVDHALCPLRHAHLDVPGPNDTYCQMNCNTLSQTAACGSTQAHCSGTLENYACLANVDLCVKKFGFINGRIASHNLSGTVQCDIGSQLAGASTVACELWPLNEPKWRSTPACTKIPTYCPSLVLPRTKHTTFHTSSGAYRALGVTASIVCLDGHTTARKAADGTSNSFVSTCSTHNRTHGYWDNLSDCKPITCPVIKVANGQFSRTHPGSPGDSGTVTCSAGHRHSTGTATCKSDGSVIGKWTPTPACLSIQHFCPLLPATNGIIRYSGDRRYDTLAELECFLGYAPIGGASKTPCVAKASGISGYWRGVLKCNAIPFYCQQVGVANGHISYSSNLMVTGTATVSCHHGYRPQAGGAVSTCIGRVPDQGSWSPKPACEPFTNYCPEVSVANGYLNFTKSRAIGAKAMLTCRHGYKPTVGNDVLTCGGQSSTHGVWDNSPACELVTDYCVNTVAVEYGKLLYPTVRTLNSIATLECDSGNVRNGTQLSCVPSSSESGVWNGTAKCTRDDDTAGAGGSGVNVSLVIGPAAGSLLLLVGIAVLAVWRWRRGASKRPPPVGGSMRQRPGSMRDLPRDMGPRYSTSLVLQPGGGKSCHGASTLVSPGEPGLNQYWPEKPGGDSDLYADLSLYEDLKAPQLKAVAGHTHSSMTMLTDDSNCASMSRCSSMRQSPAKPSRYATTSPSPRRSQSEAPADLAPGALPIGAGHVPNLQEPSQVLTAPTFDGDHVSRSRSASQTSRTQLCTSSSLNTLMNSYDQVAMQQMPGGLDLGDSGGQMDALPSPDACRLNNEDAYSSYGSLRESLAMSMMSVNELEDELNEPLYNQHYGSCPQPDASLGATNQHPRPGALLPGNRQSLSRSVSGFGDGGAGNSDYPLRETGAGGGLQRAASSAGRRNLPSKPPANYSTAGFAGGQQQHPPAPPPGGPTRRVASSMRRPGPERGSGQLGRAASVRLPPSSAGGGGFPGPQHQQQQQHQQGVRIKPPSSVRPESLQPVHVVSSPGVQWGEGAHGQPGGQEYDAPDNNDTYTFMASSFDILPDSTATTPMVGDGPYAPLGM
ncbi:uncharacterized protein LOC135821147 [Sycon ciliatum]|uniref:uncharacterized protein LOC135821147 n=1 Tax=Sycon ciliatum TaxID=27933 RepID=UPI0031F6AE3E